MKVLLTMVLQRVAGPTGGHAPPQPREQNADGDVVDLIRRMRCRVLVVDDHAMFLEGLAKRLRNVYEATVEEAEDAMMALEKLTEMAAFDVVFMDVEMPEGDGISACPKMREAGGFGQIVLMSSDPRNRARALECGEMFISKPSEDDDAFVVELERILLNCRGDRTP